MTEKQIKRLDALRDRLYDIERQLRWMDDWGRVLDGASPDEKFFICYHRYSDGKCCLQEETTRESVVVAYNLRRASVERERDEVKKEIAAL